MPVFCHIYLRLYGKNILVETLTDWQLLGHGDINAAVLFCEYVLLVGFI